jgi:hypothetical protein
MVTMAMRKKANSSGPEPYERLPGDTRCCPNCGLYGNPATPFCGQCGESVPAGGDYTDAGPVICPSCDYGARVDAAWCPSCGRPIPPAAHAYVYNSQQSGVSAQTPYSSSGRHPVTVHDRTSPEARRAFLDSPLMTQVAERVIVALPADTGDTTTEVCEAKRILELREGEHQIALLYRRIAYGEIDTNPTRTAYVMRDEAERVAAVTGRNVDQAQVVYDRLNESYDQPGTIGNPERFPSEFGE